MRVNLDFFEMYYLLESCFRGSHLRSGTIGRFVDEFYVWFSPEERKNLHDWIVRDIYDGKFEPRSQLCGADRVFMARYNPDNQYRVKTLFDGKEEIHEVFLRNGRYYTKSDRFIAEKYITSVEKIPPVED